MLIFTPGAILFVAWPIAEYYLRGNEFRHSFDVGIFIARVRFMIGLSFSLFPFCKNKIFTDISYAFQGILLLIMQTTT